MPGCVPQYWRARLVPPMKNAVERASAEAAWVAITVVLRVPVAGQPLRGSMT